MEIRILGPLEVASPDKAVRLGGPRQRAVLANLVVRVNQVVPAEQLVEEVWGDDAPPAAISSLHSYVSRLRTALGDGAGRIEWRAPGYVLHAAADEIDSLRFETLIRGARARLATEPAEAARDLATALGLWRGRPLPELAERGSLLAETSRLDELRAEAAEEWLGLELALGREEQVIANAERLLADHPLRERLWGTLMVALYRAGRQADALEAYRRVRTTLAEELGIDPSPELERLQVQILQQDPSLEQRGLQLRGYRMLEPIGEGVFGIVHRAIQPGVGREVALKAIRPRLAHHPEFIRRFEVEAQLVARLEHPRIVPLYDYWRDEYGAFLVMRWLRGGNLRDALRAGPFEPRRALSVISQIGEALGAAHAAGVVHRDLKPANVLLDDDGNAYLSDFGIAKDLAAVDGDRLPADASGYLSPEELRGEPTTTRSDVYGLGIVAYELLAGQPPWDGHGDRRAPPPLRVLRPDIRPAVDEALARALAQSPDMRHATAEALLAVLRAELLPDAAPPPTTTPRRNPYKGLQAFGASDARDFFGRERLVDSLVARLGETGDGARLLAVVGPSGSGKSSAVRAGLLPALRRGALPGSERWFVAEMLPGPTPLRELEAALRRVAAGTVSGLASLLANDDAGLEAAVDAVLPDDEAALVLVVDQLEELFTLAPDADRDRFLRRLTTAVRSPSGRLRVIVTLRADFYDRPLAQRDFGELVGARTLVVTPLSVAELEAAIRGPIEAVGGRVEPALVAALVRETVDRPGALPLLEHTLSELFDRGDRGILTLDDLEAAGGVSGAIASRAEAIFGGLDTATQELSRQLFLRLVSVADDGTVTRRRASRGELSTLDGDVDAVLEAFGRHRFLTFDHDPESRRPTVEVTHEALLDAWHRLREWLELARDEIRVHQRLRSMAAEWQLAQEDASLLARGSQLLAFETASRRWSVTMTPLERAFLETSVAARGAEDAEREAQAAREQALERRSVQRLRWLVGALTTGASVAIGLAGFAFLQVQATEREARATTARELAGAAIAKLDEDPDLSINLAIEAVEITRRADGLVLREAQEALHRTVLASRIVTRYDLAYGSAMGHDHAFYAARVGSGFAIRRVWNDDELVVLPASAVGSLAVSGDKRLVATSDMAGSVTVWDVNTASVVINLQAGTGLVDDIAFSPDGSRIAAKWAGSAALWEVASGRRSDVPFGGPDLPGIALDWNPDGSLLAVATGAEGAETIVVSGADGTVQQALPGSGRTARFSPDGSLLLSTGMNDGVLWDTSTWTSRWVLPHSGWVDGSAFSADGSLVATGGDDGFARVWDVTSGDELLALPGLGGRVGLVYFDSTGDRLAGWSANGGLLWDLTPGGSRIVRTFVNPHGSSFNVDVGPRGRILLGGRDGATMWSPTGELLVDFDTGGQTVSDIVFSPDGSTVASGWFDGTIRLWTDAGTQLWSVEGHAGQVWGVAFDPSGTLLATVATDAMGRIWDVADHRQMTQFNGHDQMWDIAWSPAEDLLVSVGDDAVAREWDARTGQPVGAPLAGHTGGVIEQAFSPDGSRVATASFDGLSIVWDVASGEPVLTLAGHRGVVDDVESTPDGTRWITASEDGTVRVWDARTGAELLALEALTGPGRLGILDDDHVAIAINGIVRIYALDPLELLTIARERVTRPLTDEECRQYLHEPACGAGATQ